MHDVIALLAQRQHREIDGRDARSGEQARIAALQLRERVSSSWRSVGFETREYWKPARSPRDCRSLSATSSNVNFTD